MTSAKWTELIKGAAEPERAERYVKLLREKSPAVEGWSEPEARLLCALLGGSEYAGNLLVANPEWLEMLQAEGLQYPRRKQGMGQELSRTTDPLLKGQDYAGVFREVRRFQKREMVRIAARDLARLGDAPVITRELSDLAEVSLNAVWSACVAQLENRYGTPHHLDTSGEWRATSGCVLGMGKLGGQELNYSSDVDVLFVYGEEGRVFKAAEVAAVAAGKGNPGKSAMTSHQFFDRVAEAFISEVSRMTSEGVLYRIDLRLRPEGDQGPLSRSLSGYENYYAQWGQTWERMMLIKARPVAGDDAVGAEFLEMVQPFRYARSISPSVLHEVAAMKDRIENEVVKAGELDRNVKLGRGGIREIEFICQALQLLHAGKQPFLQGAQTLPALEKLCEYEHLTAEQTKSLAAAYVFLRDVEHRLQMDNNLQTHTLPAEKAALARIARLMGCGSLAEFQKRLKTHTGNTRRIFEQLLKGDKKEGGEQALPTEFTGQEARWKEILVGHGFQDVERGYKVIREFVEGPGYVHVSPRTTALALKVLPRLFALCPQRGMRDAKRAVGERDGALGASALKKRKASGAPGENALTHERAVLSDPDRVATRLDSFIAAYGTRGMLFELWNSNPSIFDLLVLLFDRSEFLAELAIRTPDLVDELVTSDRLRVAKESRETLADLMHGIGDADQALWVRRYHQAELMRIGLRDILNLGSFEHYLTELSALADACLQYAVAVVMRKHKLKKPPFAVVGLGKLGGHEIDYGSDLDILFVADNKSRNLGALSKHAQEVMDLLGRRTEQGIVFHVDARLRPDGEKGLLANTLKAYEEYYRQRAMLWEVQSVSRARAIAGDAEVGAQFERLAAAISDFQNPSLPLAAYGSDWKERIHRMRMRIEKERTPQGKDALAIKTGAGGLMDAEFVAQALCLEHGWKHANTLAALELGAEKGVLPHAQKLIENFRVLRRVEGVLRRWSYEGEIVLPDDPAPYYRVSVRCGYASAEAFRDAMAKCRSEIRGIYDEVFGIH